MDELLWHWAAGRLRVEHASDLDEAVERAFAHDGPSLIEVVSDPDLV